MLELRAAQPGDAALVQDFVRNLSQRSRLERFFTPLNELSPAQLFRITAGQGLSLAAVVGNERIVGLAEYFRVRRGEVEFAVVVADEWQGQGLGEQLLRALLEHAGRAGVERVGGVTRIGNTRMRALARKLGFGIVRDQDPSLLRMERALAA
ncbi:MAG TPA: GNAT family N-acetyltransferase [Burkholderiales bacterium]|jgi:RimJ/RimL family protein N-acetyltransferase|nr:GNAT family N-acetyltransferase [Burkholderiales bacterium]